ncbi:MAG: succinyldiaminopimelate transaminase [Duodenibacillus sp.]|nr:succinyldiaminopimelate transaminase [Duodenibacillus sp.]
MSHPGLALTRPYPFARLRKLFAGIEPAAGKLAPISLGIGEPRHPLPECIRRAVEDNIGAMSHYPTTGGTPALKQAVAGWCQRRYGTTLDPDTQILPCLGSREALFCFVQSHVDTTRSGGKPVVVIPSPFYQIYEGAAFMAGAEPVYLPLTRENNFEIDLSELDEATLARTQIVFVCSPGNPTGKVVTLEGWKRLFEASAKYGFVIASDECYSEIYLEEGKAPLGALTAAKMLGLENFKNLIVFQSLSKRSNAPGMRSGFMAGDASLIKDLLLYRTYHGSAMNPMVQAASIAAWNDEEHVIENRRLYKEKFAAAQPVINSVIDAPQTEASFYLWAKLPGSDEDFARDLYAAKGVTVLPGSYLSRPCAGGLNPGAGFVRIALVAEPAEVLEAAHRIADFCGQH